MTETEQALKRLLRRVGREAARHERMYESMRNRGAGMAALDRAYGEANVLRLTQGFIRDELRKAKKP